MSTIKKLNENSTFAIELAVIPSCYGPEQVEKKCDGPDTGLTYVSYEYSAQDLERAYDIAYGTVDKNAGGRASDNNNDGIKSGRKS